VRSELWLTDEELLQISETLRGSGFSIERVEETPRKSTATSVSQMSVKSSAHSGSRRQKSVNTSNRMSTMSTGPHREGALSENERNEYRRLVQLLIRTHKTASQPFLFPVPETVVGYYDIIKKPSDLTTIRQRLDASSYLNRGEFEKDFLQMIWNAYIFNPPNSEVFRAALELHSAFIQGLQKSVIALNDMKRAEAQARIDNARKQRKSLLRRQSSIDSGGPSRSSNVHKKASNEEDIMKRIEYLHKVVKQTNAVAAKPKTPTPPLPTVKPLNDRQLDQLARDLEMIDPKNIQQVAALLRGEPTARIADGQLALTVHDLSATTQRELMKLMDKLKAQEALSSRYGERLNAYGSEDSDAESESKRHRL
jgi:hypothetical protein